MGPGSFGLQTRSVAEDGDPRGPSGSPQPSRAPHSTAGWELPEEESPQPPSPRRGAAPGLQFVPPRQRRAQRGSVPRDPRRAPFPAPPSRRGSSASRCGAAAEGAAGPAGVAGRCSYGHGGAAAGPGGVGAAAPPGGPPGAGGAAAEARAGAAGPRAGAGAAIGAASGSAATRGRSGGCAAAPGLRPKGRGGERSRRGEREEIAAPRCGSGGRRGGSAAARHEEPLCVRSELWEMWPRDAGGPRSGRGAARGSAGLRVSFGYGS